MQYILLRDKSYSVDNLPAEPRLLIELLELCHSDSANFEQFANAISQDSGLTAKILQVANSPAYRQWNQITDIRRMLIILGLTNVRKIVTTCAIQQFFASFSPDFSKNIQFIWMRALLCANLAERLAKLTSYKHPGEAFLAGLLHQVGMLLFLINREKEYLPVLDRYYASPSKFLTVENNLMQATHCELGAALVNSWKLDSFIADAIEFQHAETHELLSAPILLKVIAVASALSADNSARQNPEAINRAGELFNLTEGTLSDCVQKAVDSSQQMIIDVGFSGKFYTEEDETNYQAEQINQNNRQLGEQVRNIALANSIGREEISEFLELAKSFRVGIKTLFNLDQLMFFRVAGNKTQLLPINDLSNHQVSEISYELTDKHSLLVTATNTGAANMIAAEQGTISDRQVMRILDRPTTYCLPIHDDDTPLGLLAIGLAANEKDAFQARLPLLRLLLPTIVSSYRKCDQQSSQEPSISIPEFRKISHEISNPLTIIRNYLYILGKKLAGSDDAQQDLQYISEEIERAGNILLRAKENAGTTATQEELVNINGLIKNIEHLLNSSLYHTHKISSELLLDERIPSIVTAADKIKQILINIIKNAVEALPSQGKITVVSRDNCYQNGQQYIEITIRDNGPGIPEEILTDLFQPVQSTKAGHSGLGLTIVKNLADELHAHISCYSSPLSGTEFKLLIPRNLNLCKDEMN